MSSAIQVNGNKRFKAGNIVDAGIFHKISQQVADLQLSFNERIGQLESKVDLLVSLYTELTEKLENDPIHCGIKSNMIKNNLVIREHDCCKENLLKLSNIESLFEKFMEVSSVALPMEYQRNLKHDENTTSQLTVLLPQKKPSVRAQLSLDSSIQVITLNSECDFPEGSWLGDESNPEARVRVPITPTQLIHINTHCLTPSKMAIVLVDYLFPREVLATSNLSGKGKHCKKQLDPLMIYGIRCHLLYKFSITETEWYRIKQNIDSKCRSAWRKKAKGMFLGDNKNPMLSSNESKLDGDATDKPYILSGPLFSERITHDGEFESGVLKTSRGHFKVVRATAEQVAKFQDSDNVVHAVKVVTNEDITEILPPPQLFSVEDMDGYTLTGCGKETLTIVTEDGEVNIPIFSTEDSLEDETQFLSTE